MSCMIGITGTHSSGKSTFFEEVRELAQARGLKVGRVADVATRCREAGFPILRDHTFDSTLWIMSSVIRAELESALVHDLVLVDRPVSDAIGYLEAALQVSGRTITADERHYLYTLVGMHSSRYALLFKTNLDLSIPLGEGRDPDVEFRIQADKHITRSLSELGIRTLDPRSPESASTIRALLDRMAAAA
ncbi:hypothetical protein DF037_18085 [Burkholderia contaminans]|uniref:NadR/Ttd14 AAA domain-containing protein n=2 Tax=Burkholderia contaminans TaxID=488447 RepID=A0A3N8QUK6_9BURK|nr:hypothetical protein DF037_18085 [Burkholderia contaminans]